MANTIITANLLQKEVMRTLVQKAKILPHANRKYEGALKRQGDTVEVQIFPTTTWATGGTAGAPITNTDMTLTSETLTVDHVAQIRYTIPKIQKIQSNLDLISELGVSIAEGKATLLDEFIASFYDDSNIPTANKLHSGAAVGLTVGNIYEYIMEMSVQLDTQNVPDEGRVLFVSPAISSLIVRASEFDATAGGLDVRVNGYVGKIAGFTVVKTNNAPANHLFAMDNKAINLAMQMVDFKITEGTDGFYSNVLGELVYGGKVFSKTGVRICTLLYS